MTLPVTIIAGFLGAGKTTLLEKLLRRTDGRLYGVLINDLADINIDAALIQEAAPGRIALANGCICCTISDDLLAAAIRLVRSDSRLEHLLIECSGVSNPQRVAQALLSEFAAGAFAIDAVICLIDAANFGDLDYADTEAAIDHAAGSDLVLLNKCDLVDETLLQSIERTLIDAEPAMRIMRTIGADAPMALFSGRLGPQTPLAPLRRRPHCHRHVTGFATDAWQTDRPLRLDDFKVAISALPKSVFRAKGIFHFADRPGTRAIFQLVGKRSELTFQSCTAGTRGSSLVAIGRPEAFPARGIDRLFQAEPAVTPTS